MECSCETADQSVIVAIRGRVDEATWEDFASCLNAGIAQAVEASRPHVVIDLAQMDYMSSRGLRVLTMAKRQAEAANLSIALAAPNEVMREILAISRYDKLFRVSDTVGAAF